MNHHPPDLRPSPPVGEGREWRTALLFSCVLLSIVLNTLYQYLGAGRDDVFITLWAGKTLGVGPWFINYNGETQEISSSILGALIAKFAYWCCADTYYLANKLFGGAATLATLLTVWLNRRLFFRHWPDYGAIATVALLGFNPSFAYWSLGGLETPYYALLILIYAALAIRVFHPAACGTVPPPHPSPPLPGGREPLRNHRLWAHLPLYLSLALVQILAILCRPEGFWLIGMTLVLTGLYWPALPNRRLSIIKTTIFLPLLFLIALFALRHAMTGAIFPNPVYAKVSISHLGGFREGWNYLTGFYALGSIGALLTATTFFSMALAGYAALRLLPPCRKFPPLDSRFLVPTLAICAYEAFIVLVKGDWMEYHRFLVPTLALKMVLLVMLGEKLSALMPAPSRRWVVPATTVLLVLVVADEWRHRAPQDCSTRLTVDSFAKFRDRPNDATIGLNCAHQRDGYAIRPFIDQELSKYLAQQGHLTIVTYQGGYFPYFLRERFSPREITLVDTTGLLNLEIAKVEGEKIPTGNKSLDDIPAILDGKVPGLSERISRYHPNMIYMLADSETGQARLKAIGFERIHQAPGGVVYLKTGSSNRSPHDPDHSR